jgi:hypothetical protein
MARITDNVLALAAASLRGGKVGDYNRINRVFANPMKAADE